MFSALRIGEFRALWLAEAISVAGDQLAKVALALAVYSRTGSALLTAVVYALSFLPALAGGLGLSQLADRYPRRTVLVGGSAVQAVLVGLMSIPGMPLAAMCVLLVGVGIAQAPALAAQNAMTRDVIVDDELYFRSQDLRGVTTNTVQLLGLAGAGLLVTLVGSSRALFIDALTFVFAAALVWFQVRHRPAAADGAQHIGWSGGARYLWSQPRLRTMLGLSWLVGLAVVPEGLAAPLARQIGVGPAAVGWLLAADPLGYVIGTFLLSHFVPTARRQRLVGVLAIASLVVLLPFVVRPALGLALALLAVAGATGAYQITVGASLNSWVPNEVRGGVFGVARTGLRVSQGLGVAAGGAVAEGLGSATGAITIAALVGVLLAIPMAASWRKLFQPGAGEMQNV
ncbi:MAG TPA: MFS transporter [Pseudonocardiaceae bacterium]|jgi:predicted MFS family arabinose efflux permease|nr:MFS transporter [Pseudonocardiaceae bacterium]